VSGQPPSFDLVVATIGRREELGRFLDSVEAQDYRRVRVVVVDQNEDDRVAAVLADRALTLVHRRSPPGLARARNVGLREVDADLVSFPDDDCVYPPGLLRKVAERFVRAPDLDGLTGRAADASGASSASWETDAAVLTDDNHWNRANSAAVFLRGALVARVGEFDERLGLGSPEPWASGEETDYLIRAVRAGARIEYDPELVVQHDVVDDDPRIGLRDGASVGYLLRKHGYPAQVVARMLVRPLGGIVLSLARRDTARARYYAASLRGRITGYAGASRSKSSA